MLALILGSPYCTFFEVPSTFSRLPVQLVGLGFRAWVGASTSSFMVMGLLWTLPYVGHHDLWAIIGDWALGIWDFRDGV